MSERLPYEEQLPQQLRDFPLPDEDAAWADMKRRLEEDDDDGIIVWWRKGCAGLGLLLVALIVTGWWFFTRHDRGEHHKEPVIPRKDLPVTADTVKNLSVTGRADTAIVSKDISVMADPSSRIATDKVNSSIPQNQAVATTENRKGSGKEQKPDKPVQVARDSSSEQKPAITSSVINKPDDTGKLAGSVNDSSVIHRAQVFIAGDSSNKKTDPTKKITAPVNKDSAKKEKKSSSAEYSISGGLGLTQQLPIAGQKAVPYSSQGRSFSLADYIPSVYFRFTRENRWFIQGEFRYGAPQYNKPLTYFYQDDTTGSSSVVTEKQLQKTYYHQLPISFNYYITPEWAIGSGIVWNRFSKSVFQQSTRDPQASPDSFLSKEIVVGKDPAAEGLSKSYLQGLIESQYQWKRFSFGARYTFGLSSYLHFTLPGQPERKETNRSLQLFIRYQLFKKKLNNSTSSNR